MTRQKLQKISNGVKILSIETSCDDTGVAILEYDKTSQPKILADLVSSQIKVHAPWGGVVPMLAKREHQRNLVPLFIKALKEAKLSTIVLRHPDPAVAGEGSNIDSSPRHSAAKNDKIKTLNKILEREPELSKKLLPFLQKYEKPDIDYIAVTVGPGLEPALWVGVNFSRALSYFWNIPIIPINHIEGHIAANWLKPIGRMVNDQLLPLDFAQGKISKKYFPAIALVVSGGHTQLILVKESHSHGRNSHVSSLSYAIIGETRDDAAGEAFDKVAKMLNLGYPGGPVISKIANRLPTTDYRQNKISLPRPMLNSGDLDFSFSGLKTAVLYTLQKMTPAQIKKMTPAIASEFQQAVTDVLTAKTVSAAKKYNAKTVILAGGVAANKNLRDHLSLITHHLSLNFLVPPQNLCADNAVMIGLAAFCQLKQNRAKSANWKTVKAQANLRIS